MQIIDPPPTRGEHGLQMLMLLVSQSPNMENVLAGRSDVVLSRIQGGVDFICTPHRGDHCVTEQYTTDETWAVV